MTAELIFVRHGESTFNRDRRWQGQSQDALLSDLGWRQADVMTLPRKVWNECYRCPKFPGCDEIAIVLDLHDAPTA